MECLFSYIYFCILQTSQFVASNHENYILEEYSSVTLQRWLVTLVVCLI